MKMVALIVVLLLLKMGQSILVNGSTELEMALVAKCGLMVQDMKDTGNLIKLTVKENWYMLTVTFTKVSGSMIKLMVKVPTLMLMELTITVIGSMISNMDLVWRVGQMVQNMRVIILMERKKAKESLPLLMEATMKVSSNKMKYAVLENTTGLMVSNTMDNGVITKCMEKVFSSGKIKRSIKVNS